MPLLSPPTAEDSELNFILPYLYFALLIAIPLVIGIFIFNVVIPLVMQPAEIWGDENEQITKNLLFYGSICL
ncbi:MAG: hypothetical protein AAGD96_19570, partial [Chloroflexota bacterium]